MPYLPFRRPTFLALVILIAFGCGVTRGEDGTPFVIGFERFSRHQDIDEQASAAILISELSCTACHASDAKWLEPKRGPRLGGAGNRLRPDWMRQYISQPHTLDAGTTMPDLLHGMTAERRQEAADAIAAFLQSQSKPFQELKAGGALPVVHEFWGKGDVVRGGLLFHKVGCVACHEPAPEYEPAVTVPSSIDALLEQLDPEEIAELGLARAARRVESIPHGDLAAKYSRRALTEMLLDPGSNRPDARMPSLRLQPSEAADIAAFLLRGESTEFDIQTTDDNASLIAAGRRLFEQLRCVNCHDTQLSLAALPAKPLDSLNWTATSTCFDAPTMEMPQYRLDPAQLAAIRSVTRVDWLAETFTSAQRVEQRMLQLNCYACHARKRSGDDPLLGGIGRFRKPYFETTGHVDLGDEGRLPPSLTGVGGKLLPDSLASVFLPKTLPRRPYMTIRMPSYHRDAVNEIVQWLPVIDHVAPDTEAMAFPNLPEPMLDKSSDDQTLKGRPDELGSLDRRADVGRELVNTGCVECHPFHGESLPGVVGIDLHAIDTRVHPRWFLEFMRNPGALKPRTRMPTFFPNGKSHRPDLLDGDVDRQIGAIWNYLKDATPAPQKITEAMAKDFELSPTDHPIVLRTFMQEAGNHAIAVGLPSGWNYAFDAEQIRLSLGWRGRFLDARGTWFERFAPPADPLEAQTIRFPTGMPFILTSTDTETEPTGQPTYRFDGYTLDDGRTPTLLYQFGSWMVKDRLEAGSDSLTRTLVIRRSTEDALSEDQSSDSTSILFVAHAGDQLVRVGTNSIVDEQGLRVTIDLAGMKAGRVLQTKRGQQWQIPLEFNSDRTPDQHVLKVDYRW